MIKIALLICSLLFLVNAETDHFFCLLSSPNQVYFSLKDADNSLKYFCNKECTSCSTNQSRVDEKKPNDSKNKDQKKFVTLCSQKSNELCKTFWMNLYEEYQNTSTALSVKLTMITFNNFHADTPSKYNSEIEKNKKIEEKKLKVLEEMLTNRIEIIENFTTKLI